VPDWGAAKPPKVKALLVSALEKVRVPPAIVTVFVARAVAVGTSTAVVIVN
jgi:hypothetical protein